MSFTSALTVGARLGPYEIVAPLGAGGMGEVYRARDSKLGREVAIKVLPAAVANDPERLARFGREAQVLASLNHPNIAQIYGLEEGPAEAGPHARALVMELVEGPTLADRIAQGAIPVAEALPIARQMADALEAAHEQGIIHRDLKPANIKVREDGTVKVLDFGLAKALDPTPATSVDAVMTHSPTLTVQPTQAGVILGTAAYMSPEQARGKAVDKRADIWAFACVLYEMLTGVKAFGGDEITDTLAFIITKDVDWKALPPNTPPAILRLLLRCLEKDRKRRLADIVDARLEIEEALAPGGASDTTSVAAARGARSRERVWMAAAVALALSTVVAAAFLVLRRPLSDERIIAFSFDAPDNTTFAAAAAPILSPDGTRIVLTVNGQEGRSQLWIRGLNSPAAQSLPNTSNAQFPFWSPDGRFVGFFADGKLKKIDVTGGPPQSLCDATDGRGGTWNRDGIVLFVPSGVTGTSIFRVSAAGGVPVAVTRVDPSRQESRHRWPQFLPDGQHFLYFVDRGPQSEIAVGVLGGLDVKHLMTTDSSAQYVEPGYLLFVREGTLMGQAFDARRLELVGESFQVADRVAENINASALSGFSASQDGVLAYRADVGSLAVQPIWFDRTGKELGPAAARGQYDEPALSPDGNRLAAERTQPPSNTYDLWMFDLVRGVSSRLTFDPATDMDPVWSPDGTRIAFASRRGAAVRNLYLKSASGAGADELLLKLADDSWPTDWSKDGHFILYSDVSANSQQDVWVLPLSGDRKPQPFVQTPANESGGRFSPDGRWIAYASNENGRSEVYVQSFPASGGKWQISSSGGNEPSWRGDGREIFYRGADDKIMAVPVTTGVTFMPGVPRALFQARIGGPTARRNHYVSTADGQRFLILTPSEEQSTTPVTVVVNWTAELKK